MEKFDVASKRDGQVLFPNCRITAGFYCVFVAFVGFYHYIPLIFLDHIPSRVQNQAIY